jgi:transcriptional regulator with XRE-family HTH domain
MRSRAALAKNLILLREKRGLSQDELADLAGVDRGSISSIEGRKVSVGIDKLDKLAAALGVSTSDLIGRANYW